MAITINGNGTVTGVSVGGLPDGIVDTDMLAANAVATAKIAAGAVTAAKRGAGAILQVLGTTTETATTTTSSSFVDCTGFSLAITPSATSSKILIIAASTIEQDGSGNFTHATILRGSTNLGNSTNGLVNSHEYYYPGAQDQEQPCTMIYLDSPSTTSETTYKVQIRMNGGTRAGWNGPQNTVKGSFILVEIAG
jgi:hypothetical protein